MHLIPPPPKKNKKIVQNLCFFIQPSQEKLKTVLMQNFWGQIRCSMGEVKYICSGIHTVYFGFQVLDTGFFQSVKLGFWILKTRIPHSTSKNFLLFRFPLKNSPDSGIQISLHGRLNVPRFIIFNKKKIVPFLLASTFVPLLCYCLMVR